MARKPLLVALLVLASSTLASANTKISLITVTPGPVIFDSFGHAALMVEDDAAPGSATVYEYGAVDASRVLMGNPMIGFAKLFNNQVPTSMSKWTAPVIVTPDGAHVPMRYRDRYFAMKNAFQPPQRDRHDFSKIIPGRVLKVPPAYREIRIDELALSPEQASKLVELLEADARGRSYMYDNYNNNCSTNIRDRLFSDAVLGQGPRALLDEKIDTSIEGLVFESFDEAVALSAHNENKTGDIAQPHGAVALMAPEQQISAMGRNATSMLSMIGLPGSYASSADFNDAIQKGDQSLQMFMPGDPLATGFHKYFFAPELTAKPITLSQSMFLPSKLRDELAQMANPALDGKHVIDASKTQRWNTDQDLALVAAPVTAPQPQAPAAPAAAPAPVPVAPAAVSQ